MSDLEPDKVLPDRVLYELWDGQAILQKYHPEYRTGIVFPADRLEEAVTYYFHSKVKTFSFIESISDCGDIESDATGTLDVNWVAYGNIEDFSELSYRKLEVFL